MRSTAVKIPQLWTSPLDRDVSTTKLCFQNISILPGPAGDSGGNQAAASGFPFSLALFLPNISKLFMIFLALFLPNIGKLFMVNYLEIIALWSLALACG